MKTLIQQTAWLSSKVTNSSETQELTVVSRCALTPWCKSVKPAFYRWLNTCLFLGRDRKRPRVLAGCRATFPVQLCYYTKLVFRVSSLLCNRMKISINYSWKTHYFTHYFSFDYKNAEVQIKYFTIIILKHYIK